MAIIKNITFLKAFLAENSLPSIYSKVTDSMGFNYTINTSSNTPEHVFLIKDFPDYLNINTQPKNKLKLAQTKTLKGHLVEIKSFKSFSEYLKLNFSTKSRSNLRRYQNRLETCFNINYACYHGEIDKQEYDRLFVVLKDLLIKRFNEKQEVNYELQHLEEFHDIVYDLIISKKASLFVIYDGKKPISIRINMFKEKLGFYIISGYDIDYSKFHLGSIDMLKNIEWCFNNAFEVYDLLKGYDYYKTKWATKSHYYYNHVVYNSNSINSFFIGKLIHLKERIKYKSYTVIKGSKLHLQFKKINRGKIKTAHAKPIVIVDNPDESKIESTSQINIHKNNDYAFLRKTLYDFLFTSKASVNNTKVLKINNSQNQYLIKSNNKSQLVTIEQNE
ncbi:GNAT family N-acetyltransferase [Flavivirga eckloniae]|uniref:BioF2-like acetyltransferase domain-containing protein n=1 Tax=Flavivirga eckloniae TaxID=1803846 RepID=A0A2K9PJL1_9FLAO|nr:GNAT family N-acetyltransferase [Flavivirga eckloniae]AUP77253.1 hypothetical protein C1H87_00380 [Flavivirga eckloniae]